MTLKTRPLWYTDTSSSRHSLTRKVCRHALSLTAFQKCTANIKYLYVIKLVPLSNYNFIKVYKRNDKIHVSIYRFNFLLVIVQSVPASAKTLLKSSPRLVGMSSSSSDEISVYLLQLLSIFLRLYCFWSISSALSFF